MKITTKKNMTKKKIIVSKIINLALEIMNKKKGGRTKMSKLEEVIKDLNKELKEACDTCEYHQNRVSDYEKSIIDIKETLAELENINKRMNSDD